MTCCNLSARPGNVRRILAVTTGGLGDAILFSPVLKALRSRYPRARIELLLASRLAGAAFSQADEVDCTTVTNMNHLSFPLNASELGQFVFKARMNGGFDIGAFATGLNRKLSRLLKFTAGIREVICGPSPPIFATDLACNVALGRRFDSNISDADAFVPLTEESEKEAEEQLGKHGILWDKEKIIAVYPSTELWHRPRWELSKLAQVLDLLRKDGFQGKIVIVGSSVEGKEWTDIGVNGLVDANLAGELSILGSGSLISKCCLVIGNDGGLMHVAGALGTPLVVVMTNPPVSYRPPGQKTKVLHSSVSCCDSLYPKRPKSCRSAKCKDDISVEQVFQACVNMISGWVAGS